jgi:hypothetical protein
MANLSSIGDAIAGFVPEGPLRTLVIVTYGLCSAIAPFIYKYYLGVLAQGGKPEGSIERQDYDQLRASLKEGNLAARLYAKWLTKFLDWIEQFFGDVGTVSRTPFLPGFLRLRSPAPLWTVPAFDRCLALALIYPIATVFLIWAISGQVGPAEETLGLKHDVPGWFRGLIAAAIGISIFAYVRTAFLPGWKQRLEGLAVGAACGVSAALGVANTVLFFVGLGLVGVVSLIRAKKNQVIQRSRQKIFRAFFFAALFLLCLAAADLLPPLVTWQKDEWKHFASVFLFGLLTLLNAPFDWASLGLTRALLRRGLELKGWWPYFLAFVDACLAGVIIALLAMTMVLGAQAFDELAVRGGGAKAAVLPLVPLFDGIAKDPTAPEYWWAYALLLSTMIPSLINLAIGGMALTRGVPGVSRLLLRWIPEGRDVPVYRRPLAAVALTTQMFAGAFLGIAAQAFLAWGLLFHLMPAIGLDLLSLCRQLADLDLPGILFHVTGIIR